MSLPETDDASRYANQLQKEKTVVLLNLPHTRGRPMPGRTAAMPVAKSSRTGRAHANPAFAPDARADGKPRARIERILNAQAPSNERAQAAAGLSTPAHIAPASATQPRPSLSALPGTKILPCPHSSRMDMPGLHAKRAWHAGPRSRRSIPVPANQESGNAVHCGHALRSRPPTPRAGKRAKFPAPFPAYAGKGFPAPPGPIPPRRARLRPEAHFFGLRGQKCNF